MRATNISKVGKHLQDVLSMQGSDFRYREEENISPLHNVDDKGLKWVSKGGKNRTGPSRGEGKNA